MMSRVPRIKQSFRTPAGGVDSGAQPADAEDSAVLASDELFKGAREILIEHNAQLYRLRQTRQGKLILTK